MNKTNIIDHITKKAINDGVDIICAADEGKPHPPITQCDSYKALIEYFVNAKYCIKNGCGTPKLIIKHDKYATLKIKADEGQQFNKFATIFTDDSLEAKIHLDVPILNKEINVTAIIDLDSKNRYSCALLSYNGHRVYPEDTKPK